MSEELKSVPVGSWLSDLGDLGVSLLAKAEALVEKYKGQVGPILDACVELADAVKAFVASPTLANAFAVWHLIQSFPVPVLAAAPGEQAAVFSCHAEAKAVAQSKLSAINWGDALQFAELVLGFLSKIL